MGAILPKTNTKAGPEADCLLLIAADDGKRTQPVLQYMAAQASQPQELPVLGTRRNCKHANRATRSMTLAYLWTEYRDTLHGQRQFDPAGGTIKPADHRD
jgi:hypothetical protein